MEQVEGDLVVNKGQESKPKEKQTPGYRNFNAVDGIDAAIKLSEVVLFPLNLTHPRTYLLS